MRSRVRWASLGVAVSLAWLVASSASAEQPLPLSPVGAKRAAVLLFSGCGVEGAPPRAVSDLLALELDAANVRLKGEDEGFGAGDLLLVVRGGCDGSEPLTLRASLDRAERERSLQLDDVPDSARARTLALSLAELGELVIAGGPPETALATSEPPATTASPPEPAPRATTRQPQPATKPKPARAEVPAKPAAAVISDQERRELFAEPEVAAPVHGRDFLAVSLSSRWFGLDQPTLGGRGRVDIAPVFFGGEALYGRATSDLGNIRGLVANGFVGVRLLSLARTRVVSIEAGPRVGAGAVHVSGTPSGSALSSEAFELYLDAAVIGDVRFSLAEVISAWLSVELGAARGVVALADGARVSEFGGFFVGASLGLGFGL